MKVFIILISGLFFSISASAEMYSCSNAKEGGLPAMTGTITTKTVAGVTKGILVFPTFEPMNCYVKVLTEADLADQKSGAEERLAQAKEALLIPGLEKGRKAETEQSKADAIEQLGRLTKMVGTTGVACGPKDGRYIYYIQPEDKPDKPDHFSYDDGVSVIFIEANCDPIK